MTAMKGGVFSSNKNQHLKGALRRFYTKLSLLITESTAEPEEQLYNVVSVSEGSFMKAEKIIPEISSGLPGSAVKFITETGAWSFREI